MPSIPDFVARGGFWLGQRRCFCWVHHQMGCVQNLPER
jgi:hypothetical protein